MALINCPDCKKEISAKAPNCPNCGCPIRDNRPQNVIDKNAEGLLGKPGTGTHALNLGCLTLLIGILFLWILFSFIK